MYTYIHYRQKAISRTKRVLAAGWHAPGSRECLLSVMYVCVHVRLCISYTTKELMKNKVI